MDSYSKIEATKELVFENKTHRIDSKSAINYGFPFEHEWLVMSSREVIKRCGIERIRARVPINWELVENLKKEPIRNPILVGSDWWIWVGSQRMRALVWLQENENMDRPILVCRFTTNFLKLWNLWGGAEGVKCSSIQVQIIEVLFKSLYYGVEQSIDGVPFVHYENAGDKMYWTARDDNPIWSKMK